MLCRSPMPVSSRPRTKRGNEKVAIKTHIGRPEIIRSRRPSRRPPGLYLFFSLPPIYETRGYSSVWIRFAPLWEMFDGDRGQVLGWAIARSSVVSRRDKAQAR